MQLLLLCLTARNPSELEDPQSLPDILGAVSSTTSGTTTNDCSHSEASANLDGVKEVELQFVEVVYS